MFFSLASIFRVFENYFDLPVVIICARIVDTIDKKVQNVAKVYGNFQNVENIVIISPLL